MIIVLKKNFVKIDHDLKGNNAFMKRRKTLKLFIFITRLVIFGLIIIMLARPFIELQTTERGNPKVTILVDNSSSMEVYDLSFVNNLVKEIKKKMPVTVRSITSDKLTSNLGEDIISYLEHDSNILLISDLQTTEGISLEDALLHSSLLNATVSTIQLNSNAKDASVWIEGETKATRNQNVSFLVHVNKLNIKEYDIVISVDGKEVYEAKDTKEIIKIIEKFDIGDHTITAKLKGDDDILENNEFHKVISVVPQPNILYVTRTSSQLPDLLEQYYQIEKVTTIPSDLSKYYAVIIEDMNTNQINNIEALSEFTSEGNGVFVVGGTNSFDRGGYKSSMFETLLPVTIGRGEKKQGDSNIVILIDMSGSTQDYWITDASGELVEVKDTKPLDVIKALAVDVIETLNRGNRVGVVAFAIPDPEERASGSFKAVKISDIDLLGNIKNDAVDKISKIQTQGQSLFDVGFGGAYSLLKHESGARNIILISDGGKNVYQTLKDNALNTVLVMADQGIRTYTVGVGRNVDDEYLKQLASAGNGIYFPAGQENKLKILFGTPEEKDQGDEMTLFILNSAHFITRDLELNAKIYGFNQVIPKNLARVIITTDSGEPALTEWRYGLGKVITLTVFSGNAGLGQILTGDNSRLLTRTLNYLIGDPERKEEYLITIQDTRINELVDIHVISKEYPKSDIELVKTKENEYVGRIKPETLGINTLLNKKFAVNYPMEFQHLGMIEGASDIVKTTGGKVFNPEDTEEIIKHITSVSKRTRITKTYITWPILLLIIIIYLFEIGCRKIIENRRKI